MKRGEPLKRHKPLLPGKPIARARSRLNQRSAKTARVYREERVPLVKEMLDEDPYCEMARRIRTVDPTWRSCTLYAIGLHELRKRSQGGSITDRSNVLRTCGPCNSWVEDRPTLAHQAGLVIRAGDPGVS